MYRYWHRYRPIMQLSYRYRHRYRPIWKSDISVVIGIGRYEKMLIGRPLIWFHIDYGFFFMNSKRLITNLCVFFFFGVFHDDALFHKQNLALSVYLHRPPAWFVLSSLKLDASWWRNESMDDTINWSGLERFKTT